jgi:hypothetical protein
MNSLLAKTLDQESRLCETSAAELAAITGGAFIVVGDGYCGTPYPWPPRPLQVAGSFVVDPAPQLAGAAMTQQFKMG